jgi:hypothetical protein
MDDMTEPLEDDNEFLNNFIASMDDSIKAVTAECERMSIPSDRVPFYLMTTMPHMTRLLKMMHALKAQSNRLDIAETRLNNLTKG